MRLCLILFELVLLYVLGNGGYSSNMYEPYNITFDSTGFEWYIKERNLLNIPEYERISFVFLSSSSLEPVTEIKYGIRIVSPLNNKPLQRTVYIKRGDASRRVSLNLTDASAFHIVVRCLLKVPDMPGYTAAVWSIQDTGILYTCHFSIH